MTLRSNTIHYEEMTPWPSALRREMERWAQVIAEAS